MVIGAISARSYLYIACDEETSRSYSVILAVLYIVYRDVSIYARPTKSCLRLLRHSCHV